MRLRFTLLIGCLLSGMGCAQSPDVPGVDSEAALAAPYPDLLPLSTLLNGQPGPVRITPETTQNLTARVAALRTRAARLSGPVVDPDTRARMNGAIDRAALR